MSSNSSPPPADHVVGGSLHKVDCESLDSLVHQYDKALEDNFSKRDQFQKFRDDYIKLKSRLKTLPDKIEYDAMVPICSKALCPGKIIHTNEILVLLGENTFIECTAKDAAEIITHRLKKIDDTLNRVEKERELYNSWKIEAERQMVETLGDGTIEIIEEYDEVKEKKWRNTHREKVRKHHQELARQRQALQTSAVVNNLGKTAEEEKLWTRLDALELEEEFMEAQAIYEQRMTEPVGNNHNDDNKCTVKIRERSNKSKLSLPEAAELLYVMDNRDADNNSTNAASGKKVTFSPDNIIHNLTDLNTLKKKGKDVTECCESRKDDIVELYIPSEQSIENGLYDPIFIRFRHEALHSSGGGDSNKKAYSENSTESLQLNSSAELLSEESSSDSDNDEDYQIVRGPGDIYAQFGPPSLEAKSIAVPGADKTPLKSILKPRGPDGGILDGNRSSSDSSKISHKELCTSANVNMKKALLAETISPEITERCIPESSYDDTNIIYKMFPGFAPTTKTGTKANNLPDEFESANCTAADGAADVNMTKPIRKDNSSFATAGANIKVNSTNSSTTNNRPISLFKKMKSGGGDRALSNSDSTAN